MTPPPPPPPPPPAAGLAEPSTHDAQTVAELLTRQRDHYRQLKALSDQQQALVASGQPEQLLALLGQRQAHVEQLTRLNDELAPLRPRMSELADAAPQALRDRLRGLVDDVESLLEAIIAQDEQDKKRLSANRDAVRQELDQVVRTPSALSAYKAAVPQAGQPRFTDRRG